MATQIYCGDTLITGGLKIGDSNISRIYLGSQKIYPRYGSVKFNITYSWTGSSTVVYNITDDALLIPNVTYSKRDTFGTTSLRFKKTNSGQYYVSFGYTPRMSTGWTYTDFFDTYDSAVNTLGFLSPYSTGSWYNLVTVSGKKISIYKEIVS